MEHRSRTYPAKIILFGEYGVTIGGEILAYPLPSYQASWIFDMTQKPLYDSINKVKSHLLKLYQSNLDICIDFDLLEREIAKGIQLKSDIPTGYGLGSSGAFTAAFYDRYLKKSEKTDDPLLNLKKLSLIESCFHGVSSGIDPLVIYHNTGVHIVNKEIKILPNESSDLQHYFLIDTGISRSTGPLVNQYLKQIQQDEYFALVQGDYLHLISLAIQYQLSSSSTLLKDVIQQISEWQYEYLSFTIPEDFKKLWYYSLNNYDFSIKLCGAGGGGFLLGFTDDYEKTSAKLAGYDLIKL